MKFGGILARVCRIGCDYLFSFMGRVPVPGLPDIPVRAIWNLKFVSHFPNRCWSWLEMLPETTRKPGLCLVIFSWL